VHLRNIPCCAKNPKKFDPCVSLRALKLEIQKKYFVKIPKILRKLVRSSNSRNRNRTACTGFEIKIQFIFCNFHGLAQQGIMYTFSCCGFLLLLQVFFILF
jgi:hypothetical protein